MVGESLPGFEVLTWYGLCAPAHTPRDIVMRVHSETVKSLASAETRTRLASEGCDADGNTPEQFTAAIRRDLARWKG